MDDTKNTPEKSGLTPDANMPSHRSCQRRLVTIAQDVQSFNALHLVAGFSLVFLGLAVVLISILGFIKPFWLSSAMSIGASISTMVGAFFCYSTLSALRSDELLQDAMRRIVHDRN